MSASAQLILHPSDQHAGLPESSEQRKQDLAAPVRLWTACKNTVVDWWQSICITATLAWIWTALTQNFVAEFGRSLARRTVAMLIGGTPGCTRVGAPSPLRFLSMFWNPSWSGLMQYPAMAVLAFGVVFSALIPGTKRTRPDCEAGLVVT